MRHNVTRKTGRPPKYDEAKRAVVLTLAANPDISFAQIEEITGVPRSTARYWIQQERKRSA
jgi:hypothetical protein